MSDASSLSEAIAGLLKETPKPPDRFILGISGPPGAGKSTVAQRIQHEATARSLESVIVGMDGWHRAHSTLEREGIVGVKGAPHTFDADGFVATLRRIRTQKPGDRAVWVPEFRRELEDPIAGAIAVEPRHRLVIVEGNYLLLSTEPWSAVRGLLDTAWFLEPDDALRRQRLIARHERFGRSHEQARAHALGSDEDNAIFIASHSDLQGVLRVATA